MNIVKENKMTALKEISGHTKKVFEKLKDSEIPQQDEERLKLMGEIGLTNFGPFQLKCASAEEIGFKRFDLFELAEMLTGEKPKKFKSAGFNDRLDWIQPERIVNERKRNTYVRRINFKVNGKWHTIAPLNYLKTQVPYSVMCSIAECKENQIFHTVLGMAPSEVWNKGVRVIDPLVMGVIFENPRSEYQNLLPGENQSAALYFLAMWPD
jgi:hypothetical protein